ncbi:hypothetical protein CL629_01070 [bacterium]|nr:hypothetical protein [bacterium]|tara:strand:- start:1088 stop:1315 length:228 start_codon:yes stop_codon:yes gene_type:complete
MKEKINSFFDSLWFNAIASVVSIGVLVERVVTNYLSGDYYHEFILIIVWVVILFHFIAATIKANKKRREAVLNNK